MATKVNVLECTEKKKLDSGKIIYAVKITPVQVGENIATECESFNVPFSTGEQEAELIYDEKYKRFNIKKGKSGNGGGWAGGGRGGETPEERQAEREQISRNSGVNYAVQLFTGGKLDIPEGMKSTDAVIAAAKKFSDFILTGSK